MNNTQPLARETAIILIGHRFYETMSRLSHETTAPENCVSVIDEHRIQCALSIFEQRNSIWVAGLGKNCLSLPSAKLGISIMEILQGSEKNVMWISTIAGNNEFSEIWNACTLAQKSDIKKIIVVSSDFYLDAFRDLWKTTATRYGVAIDFLEVRHGDNATPALWETYRTTKLELLTTIASKSARAHLCIMTLVDLMAHLPFVKKRPYSL